MIAQLFLPEGSTDVLIPFISRIENLFFCCLTLWNNSFPSHSPAGQVLNANSEFFKAWTGKDNITHTGNVFLVFPIPLWQQSDESEYNCSLPFLSQGDWVSVRDRYEKILPPVSDSKLLKENLAQLENLGGKKNQLQEIQERGPT